MSPEHMQFHLQALVHHHGEDLQILLVARKVITTHRLMIISKEPVVRNLIICVMWSVIRHVLQRVKDRTIVVGSLHFIVGNIVMNLVNILTLKPLNKKGAVRFLFYCHFEKIEVPYGKLLKGAFLCLQRLLWV